MAFHTVVLSVTIFIQLILENLFRTCPHLVGAFANLKVLLWKVSSSTWGVASVPICIKRGDRKTSSGWQLDSCVSRTPILYARTLRYSIIVQIKKNAIKSMLTIWRTLVSSSFIAFYLYFWLGVNRLITGHNYIFLLKQKLSFVIYITHILQPVSEEFLFWLYT